MRLHRRAVFAPISAIMFAELAFAPRSEGAAIEAELIRIAERLRILCPVGAHRLVYQDAEGRPLVISIGNPDFGGHPDVPRTPGQAWDHYVSVWASAPRPETVYRWNAEHLAAGRCVLEPAWPKA
jgi:hypothetical protein